MNKLFKSFLAVCAASLLISGPAVSAPIESLDTIHVKSGKVGMRADSLELRSSGSTGVAKFKYADSSANSPTYTLPSSASGLSLIGTSTGTVTRSDLVQQDAASFPVALQNVRGNTGLTLVATETAGGFNIVNGGVGTGGLHLLGEVANNETELSVMSFEFALPPEYVAGETVTLAIDADITGAGTSGASTIDVEAYELTAAGAVGSDLCATAAQTQAKATPTTHSFTITPTGLAPGDRLQVFVSASVVESASANLNARITKMAFLLDIKG